MPLVQDNAVGDLDSFLDVAIRDDHDVNTMLMKAASRRTLLTDPLEVSGGTSRRSQARSLMAEASVGSVQSRRTHGDPDSNNNNNNNNNGDHEDEYDDNTTVTSKTSRFSRSKRSPSFCNEEASSVSLPNGHGSSSRDLDCFFSDEESAEDDDDDNDETDNMVGMHGDEAGLAVNERTYDEYSTARRPQNEAIERALADMKVELAEARSQADWYKLQHKQLQVEFEDLQAFCQQLQKENVELRAGRDQPLSRRPRWFKAKRLDQLQRSRKRTDYPGNKASAKSIKTKTTNRGRGDSSRKNSFSPRPKRPILGGHKKRPQEQKQQQSNDDRVLHSHNESIPRGELVVDDDGTQVSTLAAEDVSLASSKFMPSSVAASDDYRRHREDMVTTTGTTFLNHNSSNNSDDNINHSSTSSTGERHLSDGSRTSDKPINITVHHMPLSQQQQSGKSRIPMFLSSNGYKHSPFPPRSTRSVVDPYSSLSSVHTNGDDDDDDDEKPEDVAPVCDIYSESLTQRPLIRSNNGRTPTNTIAADSTSLDDFLAKEHNDGQTASQNTNIDGDEEEESLGLSAFTEPAIPTLPTMENFVTESHTSDTAVDMKEERLRSHCISSKSKTRFEPVRRASTTDEILESFQARRRRSSILGALEDLDVDSSHERKNDKGGDEDMEQQGNTKESTDAKGIGIALMGKKQGWLSKLACSNGLSKNFATQRPLFHTNES